MIFRQILYIIIRPVQRRADCADYIFKYLNILCILEMPQFLNIASRKYQNCQKMFGKTTTVVLNICVKLGFSLTLNISQSQATKLILVWCLSSNQQLSQGHFRVRQPSVLQRWCKPLYRLFTEYSKTDVAPRVLNSLPCTLRTPKLQKFSLTSGEFSLKILEYEHFF